MARAGCACRPGFFLRCGCSPACSGGSSWRGSPTRTRRAGWRSSASSTACADRTAFAAHLAPLQEEEWFVYAKPPFAGPEAVLAYLARYTHRVAISNSRLIGLDDDAASPSAGRTTARNGRARFAP